MNDMSAQITSVKTQFVAPTVTVVSNEEVLRLFQMTASEIGAAATWWACSC